MKNKKHGIGSIILLAVLAVFFLFFAFVMFVADYEYLLGAEARDVMDYADDGVTPPKDIHVKVKVDACLGNYAETQHKINYIIPAGTEEHYIVWLDNNAAISVTVKNKKTIKLLNGIIDDTWDYLYGSSDLLPEGIVIEGKVSTMDSEISGYYDDYLEEMGFDSSGFPIYNVTIDTTETRLKGWSYVIFLLASSVGCVIGMIASIKARKKEKLAAEAFNASLNNYNNMYSNMNQNAYPNTDNTMYNGNIYNNGTYNGGTYGNGDDNIQR